MGITAIFYVIIFFAGIIATLSGRIIIGLYLYFFTLYFHAPSQWWGEGLPDLRWSLVASLVTVVALLMHPPKAKMKFWVFRENRFLSVLMLFVFVQEFWVDAPEAHHEYVVLLYKFILLIFLVQNMAITMKEVRGIIVVNVLGTAYLAYYGMSTMTSGRMESIGNGWDSNLVAMHFAAVLFLGGYLLLEKFRWSHLILMAAIAVILMGLFRTESRGALLAMGVTGVLCLFFRPQRSFGKMMMFGVLAIVACSMLMGPQIIERFQGIKSDGTGELEDKSAQSRIVVIQAQYAMWKESMFVGHGHRATLLLSPKFIPSEYQTSGGVRASHNVVMSFLVDHGVLGFALYFAAIGSCLVRVGRYKAPPGQPVSDVRDFYSNMLIACCAALCCFMIGGLGADNKKLETDVWLMALIPLIHQRLSLIDSGKKVA